MKTLASHTNNSVQLSEIYPELLDADGMSLAFIISLVALFNTTAVSVSSVVEVISINTLLGVLSLLIILPILISGIINLILIIS